MLFERYSRGMNLNELGLRFLPQVVALLRETERLKTDVTAEAVRPGGQLHIGTASLLRRLLVTPSIVRFLNRYPEVGLKIHEGTSRTVRDRPYLQQHINYHWAKERIQFDLYRSGMPYSVLLPANLMQNVSWTWPSIVEKGRWELPYSTLKKLTWVDLDDVAEAAANVLSYPGYEYGTYELCGSKSFLSRDEIAVLMSSALGRKIRAVKIDINEYLALARTQPFFERMSPEEISQIRAVWDACRERNGSVDDPWTSGRELSAVHTETCQRQWTGRSGWSDHRLSFDGSLDQLVHYQSHLWLA